MNLKLILILSIFFTFYLQAQIIEDDSLKKINVYLYQDPEKAIQKGIKLVKNTNEIDKKINYLLFLSKAYTAKRDIDQSLHTLLKAQELLKQTNNSIIKIDIYIIIAIQYQHMELYSKSLELLDEAEKIAENLDPNLYKIKYSWLGKSNAVKGIIYRSQGNYDIAHTKLMKAVSYFEQADNTIPNINNLSIVYYNIAYNYIDLKNYKLAHDYFEKSLQYAVRSDAKSLQSFALKGLAENYSIQNNPNKSLELLKKAIIIADNIGDLRLLEGIYKGLADNYLSIDNFYFYNINNEKYKKVMFDREQIELKSIHSFMDNLRLDYNQQTKKIENQSNFIYFSILTVGCFVVIFISYKIFLTSKRNKYLIDKLTKHTI